jgi:hypothetical protein
LKFLGEVWAWQAWAGANEEELTKVPKSWGSLGKIGGGKEEKRGTYTVGRVKSSIPHEAWRFHFSSILFC